MKKLSLIALTLFLSACAQPGKVGDECSEDTDCAEGLECHHEDHDDHGDEEHEEEEEAHGTCSEHEDGEDDTGA